MSVAVLAILVGYLLWVQTGPAPSVVSAPAVPASVAVDAPPPVALDNGPRENQTPEPEKTLPQALVDSAPPPIAAWRLPPAEGVALMGDLYDRPVEEPSRDICSQPLGPQLRCESRDEGTWNELLKESRPALLRLVDERRFETRALFLGVDRDQAVVATPTTLVSVPVADLAEHWTGEYWRLWRAPPEIKRTLKRGDRGADVQFLARLFAEIDGQDVPLTEDLFGSRLEQRLKFFQDQHGLDADGVLGEQTLRALSLNGGIDLNNEAARSAVASRAAPDSASLAFEES